MAVSASLKTPSERATNPVTQSYTALAQSMRTLGLQGRTRWFYVLLFAALLVALGGAAHRVDPAGRLLAAAADRRSARADLHPVRLPRPRGIAPADPRFGPGQRPDRPGAGHRVRRHQLRLVDEQAHPAPRQSRTRSARTPTSRSTRISFLEEDAASRRGLMAWFTRRQGYLFFPLLLLEGLNLHVSSIMGLFGRRKVEGRWLELTLLGARFAVYLAALFWLLPLGMAFAFLGVQLAVFGVYMGASFAPNHVGMPIVPRDAKLDFLSKQVRTSRNVSGGWWATVLMGGLNYQIEHHLFPSMPRPHLAKARELVREHCRPSTSRTPRPR